MKKFKKALSVLLVLVLLSLTAAGCSQNNGDTAKSDNAAGDRTITDMSGVDVTVPAEVKSVINLWPSSNQIMITLGAQDKQTAYMATLQKPSFTWMQIVNPAIMEKQTVGGNGDVTAEELLNLKPDLVITSSDEDAEAYRAAGLNAACMMFNNYDGLKESVLKTGEALGSSEKERADKYVEYLEKNIKLVQDRLKDVKDEDKPVVHYVDGQSGTSPYKTTGNGTMQEEWLTMAGGKLSTDGILQGMSKEITPEQFLSINPDVIIVGGTGQADAYDALMNDASLANLKAVQDGKVYRNPQGTFQWDRFGSESALQVLWVAKTLYPDKFEDIDMKKETISFYKDYLGYDLSDEYADAILAGKNAPDGR